MSTKSLRLVLEERERTKPQSDEEEDSEHEETTGHKKNLFELVNIFKTYVKNMNSNFDFY